MTNNQLTVPETSDDQIALVQQILDDPHDHAPAVQVRFAKRVGRPGSSRVMLMDAQTSGPVADEDEESISNLALRLADGTNVQLSLSFFNDNQPALVGAGGGGGGGGRRATFAPFNTYVYEPRTYTIHKSESKLPLIMMTTAIVLAGTCYGLISGPLSNYLQNKSAKTAAVTTAPKVAPAKVVPPHVVVQKIAHLPIPVVSPMDFEIATPVKASAKKQSPAYKVPRTTHSQSPSTQSSHAPRNDMFVPPPPPMAFSSPPARGFVPPPPPTPYTVPAGIPTAYDPLQSLAPAVAHSNRAYAPAKKIDSVSAPAQVTPIQSRVSASVKPEVSYEKPVKFDQPVESRPATAGQDFNDSVPAPGWK